MRTIAVSFKSQVYHCQYDWPDNCFVQCGDAGLVIAGKGGENSYETPFFEAFPETPKTFIRGEGETIELAEKQAFQQLQQISACSNHEFERRNYRNGSAFCNHCNLFQCDVFDPLEHCIICSIPTYYIQDIDNNWYCEEHKNKIPENKQPKHLIDHEKFVNWINNKRK